MAAKKAGVKISTVKEAANALRDLKNWIFVFAEEYDLPEEAVNKLHEKVDDVAEKLRM